jgi:hypothetical protein
MRIRFAVLALLTLLLPGCVAGGGGGGVVFTSAEVYDPYAPRAYYPPAYAYAPAPFYYGYRPYYGPRYRSQPYIYADPCWGGRRGRHRC